MTNMYLYLTKQTHLIWDGSVIETTLPVYQVSSLHIVHIIIDCA